MRNKKYCILNKQYTKEEYEKLVQKIITQMSEMPYVDMAGRRYGYGEFFPSDISLYGYNETVAMDYYPLSKKEASRQGFLWNDHESTKVQGEGYIVPDDISEVSDDILKKIIICEESGRPFRLLPMELTFYRRMNLPVPVRAPLQRHKDRIARLTPRKLFSRTCMCKGEKSDINGDGFSYMNHTDHGHPNGVCGVEMETPYSPERPEIVYCESCYQHEIA
jgi:hypothetical protein